ncbi:MAG: TetR/AcrR family transcriptional regulator [Chthonomonadaceae bacterium]|nr:TetR/AcrR family transcriptional regulator [Chthonomonadaceae bacterium]
MPRVAEPLDVREAILEAATRLLERNGYRKMTMEDIAQEAHIGKSTIYGYFSNKEEVAISVVEAHWRKVESRWSEIAALSLSPKEKMTRMLMFLVMSSFDKAQSHRASLDDTMASLRSLIVPRRENFYKTLVPSLTQVLEEGCHEKTFECDDTRRIAQTILVCFSGLNPSNLSPRELGEREEIETRTRQVIALMLTGLSYRPIEADLDAKN